MMTRSLRRWHIRFWLMLGPLIAIGLVVALIKRPSAPIQADIRPVPTHPNGAANGANWNMDGRVP